LTYRLLPKSEAPVSAAELHEPDDILNELPEYSSHSRNFDAYAPLRARADAIAAHWALRFANEVTLSTVASPQKFDQTIAMTYKEPSGFHAVTVSQVEVKDASGQVQLRHQRVTAQPVRMPLLFLPSSAGPRWGPARTDLHTGEGDYRRPTRIRAVSILFDETTLARP
jgi:hypothetical protein